MCLSTIDEKITVTSGVGYKYVKRNLGTYRSKPHWRNVEPIQLKMGEWIHDNKPLKELLETDPKHRSRISYKPGFHINLTSRDAQHLARMCGWNYGKVVKVRFHHVVAQGTQYMCTVIVARCIKVVRNDSR